MEATALVQVGLTRLALRLEQVAQERDPLADALQRELGRESRAAYLKDWRTCPVAGGHSRTSRAIPGPLLPGWSPPCHGRLASAGGQDRSGPVPEVDGRSDTAGSGRRDHQPPAGLAEVSGPAGRSEGVGRNPAPPVEGTEAGEEAPPLSGELSARCCLAYRDYLKGCDASAYLAAEQQAAQTRQGVWRWGDTVQRP